MRRSKCNPGRLLRAACDGAPLASATATQAPDDAIAPNKLTAGHPPAVTVNLLPLLVQQPQPVTVCET
jgi:hypothetical protein